VDHEFREGSAMATVNLGANEITFVGHGTQITYFPEAPGPLQPGQEGGRLEYHGSEGNRTFNGQEVSLQESPLGTLVTVTLRFNADAGGLTATVVVPQVFGVTGQNSVEFDTVLVKAASRGFTARPGPQFAYTVLHLKGAAKDVILPFAREGTTAPPTTPQPPSGTA
jgi:hypothetical protein